MPRKTQNLCNVSEFALWIRFELFNTEASLHLLVSAAARTLTSVAANSIH